MNGFGYMTFSPNPPKKNPTLNIFVLCIFVRVLVHTHVCIHVMGARARESPRAGLLILQASPTYFYLVSFLETVSLTCLEFAK